MLGIKLTHSQPGRPQGRGKIERYFRTVRDKFLVEISDSIAGTGTPVASLAELNSLFTAWVEQVYHQRVHTETDQTPLQRFLAAGPPAPTPAEGAGPFVLKDVRYVVSDLVSVIAATPVCPTVNDPVPRGRGGPRVSRGRDVVRRPPGCTSGIGGRAGGRGGGPGTRRTSR